VGPLLLPPCGTYLPSHVPRGSSCRRFTTHEHGGLYSNSTPQAITVTDAQAAGPCTFIAVARCGLRLVWLPGSLFDPLRQFLVAPSDFAHLLPGVRVVHGLGSGQDFFGAGSKVPGER